MKKHWMVIAVAISFQLLTTGCMGGRYVKQAEQLFDHTPNNALKLSWKKVQKMKMLADSLPNEPQWNFHRGYAYWAYAKHLYAQRTAAAKTNQLGQRISTTPSEIPDKILPLMGMGISYLMRDRMSNLRVRVLDLRYEFLTLKELVEKKCKYWGAILKNTCHRTDIVRRSQLIAGSCKLARTHHPFYCR